MIEMNNDLIIAMRKFKELFGDVVPLREFPQNVSNADVIQAINASIEAGTNMLPEKFGYQSIEEDKNIII